VNEVHVSGSDAAALVVVVIVADIGGRRRAVSASGVAMTMSQLVEMLFPLLLNPAKQGAVRLCLLSDKHLLL